MLFQFDDITFRTEWAFQDKKWITVTDEFGENILNFKRTLAVFNNAVPDITVRHNLSSDSYINVSNVT